jgi:nucleoside-diphosphate-sugar epimerase
MKVLFVGGTGTISTACTKLAAQRGIDLTLVTRSQHDVPVPPGVKTITADIHHKASVIRACDGLTFDAVVDWIAYTPADIERDLDFFLGRTRQFIFISSAAAYQRPPSNYLITESTPLSNPYWEYARNKIACEERLWKAHREYAFPVTIVRPSLTFGDMTIPLVINSSKMPYTVVDRMLRGQEVIVPGDGSSLWVITHNSDFAKGLVGLLGNEKAIGQAFHITTDEVKTWDQFYRDVGEAIGVEPRPIHIPSDFIIACLPDQRGRLLGDKSTSVVFDNSKIKRFIPEYRATTTFAEGIRQSLAWFGADASRKQIDSDANATWDKLIALYEKGMHETSRSFR